MTVECKAKNPTMCRYHGVDAERVTKSRKTTVDKMYTRVVNAYQYMLERKPEQAPAYLEAYLAVKTSQQEADLLYYGTDEGEEKLVQQINETEDLNEKLKLETLHHQAVAQRQSLAENPNVNDALIPTHEPVFTFPETTLRTDKLGNRVDAVGNKHSDLHTFPRIRDMVKADFKKATKLGFLGDSAVKVGQDRKTETLLVTIVSGDENVVKRAGKIADAYNKREWSPETGQLQSKKYGVKVLVQKPVLDLN